MKRDYRDIEELLPGYLSGDLSDEDRTIIDEWRTESPGNEILFQENIKAWEAMPLLLEMEQFNSFAALKKINTRISDREPVKWWGIIQRTAAILLIPLLVYSGYITFTSLKNQQDEQAMVQTITSRQGMVTQFDLADGTKVWLNSGSSLQFPARFTGDLREVKLMGEAFFKVTKNEKQSFRVNAKDFNIEVLGTSFNVVSYDDEHQTELVLVEGEVKLAMENDQVKKVFGTLHPGQRAIYKEATQKVEAEEVEVDRTRGG